MDSVKVWLLIWLMFNPLLLESFQLPMNSFKKMNSHRLFSNQVSTTKKTSNNILSQFGARFIAAPMVAQSDLAFRLLVQRYGCDICFTQMIHARLEYSLGLLFKTQFIK